METSRRVLLKGGLVAAGVTFLPGMTGPPIDLRPTAAAVTPFDNPFSLGVASGDPSPDGFVLWTRLAQLPLDDDGLGGMGQSVREVAWQVATDPGFRRVVRRGRVRTGPAQGHSIHLEPSGLEPDRDHWYRFRLGRHLSPVGHTRTAPRPESAPAALAVAYASCAQWEHGYFTAYRRMAEDEPDLVLHLGDYMYEYDPDFEPAKTGNVRHHEGPETVTLADYRRRHAQYKTDEDLQLLHATAPWVAVFDDHEVSDNWADESPGTTTRRDGFGDRRAAALRAYWENMPLRRSAFPQGPDMKANRRFQWGRLATFHMLDTRQYRDPQACGDGMGTCEETWEPDRSILGAPQEAWVDEGLRTSTATWDVLGQQVPFGRLELSPVEIDRLSMDTWDGYPSCRDRVLDSMAQAANPVVLTGDVHDSFATEVWRDHEDPSSVAVPEIITTSVSTNGDGEDTSDGGYRYARTNPQVKFWNELRGYVNLTFTAGRLDADYRNLPYVHEPGAPVFTRASFAVEAGSPLLHQTGAQPLAGS
ncbi:alkaline phosphatase D [Nocardioides exalbidus]|uniref:Alkaline phosphatase D n=1 Tax=Nocardioides exalbidus TaxID=402596 RepID=A0A1H4I3Y2_9ACTN|nr:alkaline phosphatase D family protein [Nocardioides exalbidus]SEB28615.1 alkaline phosphatase D [Nocardioides exalbidus]